jgi:subtilisin family serine protease
MPYAWEVTQGSTDVVVAVVDTGVYAHPDLLNNLWVNAGETDCNDGIDNDGNGKVDDCSGWNFYDLNNNTGDDDGHGTHVAGIIGAVGNNSIGISGVAWQVKVMPVRFIGATGGSIADECGHQYAVQNGAQIINASFGCDTDYPEDCTFSISEYEAIRCRDAGVLFVAAAGTAGTTMTAVQNTFILLRRSGRQPNLSGLNNIISVTATTRMIILRITQLGAASVHIAAPAPIFLVLQSIRVMTLCQERPWRSVCER